MNRFLVVFLIGALVGACGRREKPPRAPAATKPDVPDQEEDAVEKELKAAQPKSRYAKVAMTPVKGARLKPFIISFAQEEEEDTSVSADPIDGLRAGTYHLVIHEAERCGPNATKAGAVWPGSANMRLRIKIARDLSGGLESTETKAMLDGDTAITGHSLVLHDDKNGKPGKAIACGTIEQTDEP